MSVILNWGVMSPAANHIQLAEKVKMKTKD